MASQFKQIVNLHYTFNRGENSSEKKITFTKSCTKIYGSPQNFTLSPSGKYLVFHNIDFYAGDGSRE
jgi:hypothetical protein